MTTEEISPSISFYQYLTILFTISAVCTAVTEKRVRKSIERLSEVYDKDFEANKQRKPVLFEGSGAKLGEIERVKDAFHRSKIDKEMSKKIHMLCYKTLGQAQKRNIDIKKFNGFKKDDENEIRKRISLAEKMTTCNLKFICDLFNIPTAGKHKKEISVLLVDFLSCPTETGSVAYRTAALRPKHNKTVKSLKVKDKTKKIKTTKEEVKVVSEDVEMNGDASLSEIDSVEKVLIATKTKKISKAKKDKKEVKLKEENKEKFDNENEEEEKYDLTDDNFKAKIKDILKDADLNSTTLNQVCDKVVSQFPPEVDLLSKRFRIKELVKMVIDEES